MFKLARVLLLVAGNAFALTGVAVETTVGDEVPLMPARLGYVDGDVSFRRGDGDWNRALLNTPLVPADVVATGADGHAEIQVSARGFVRLAPLATVTLVEQSVGRFRFGLADGTVSVDVREPAEPLELELFTQFGAVYVREPGYYRFTVSPGAVQIAVQTGRARIARADGAVLELGAAQQAMLTDASANIGRTIGGADAWDDWNRARTDTLVAASSNRYLPDGAYGAQALDEYGDWRQDTTYGAVWYPRDVAPDWAPYTYGTWIDDPYYGRSWVDYSPWGWAPFHYGRWVRTYGRWAWCPQAPFASPYYAPALVRFPGGWSTGGWVVLGWHDRPDPWWRRWREDRDHGHRGGHDGRGHDGRGHDGRGHDGRGHDGRGHDGRGHDGQGGVHAGGTPRYDGHGNDPRVVTGPTPAPRTAAPTILVEPGTRRAIELLRGPVPDAATTAVPAARHGPTRSVRTPPPAAPPPVYRAAAPDPTPRGTLLEPGTRRAIERMQGPVPAFATTAPAGNPATPAPAPRAADRYSGTRAAPLPAAAPYPTFQRRTAASPARTIAVEAGTSRAVERMGGSATSYTPPARAATFSSRGAEATRAETLADTEDAGRSRNPAANRSRNRSRDDGGGAGQLRGGAAALAPVAPGSGLRAMTGRSRFGR
ncbi:MAG: FecR domain-containing protein [Gammaproteobacteria bacterium]|nr:FecR domain-containing protein [Gammaproteobacteria bacterium]